jgi:hypothetical protein
MKYIFSFLVLNAFLFSSIICTAQSAKLKSVQVAVDHLKRAMISGDRIQLSIITSDYLSYGHSGGHVEGKFDFIEKISSGKSDFVSMDITEQTINIKGKTAIVRHNLDAVTNDNGKPGIVKLKVLLVFLKEHGDWKLFARQAVKS